MIFGHNTNVSLGQTTYHVQTEDAGITSALIDTTVFCAAACCTAAPTIIRPPAAQSPIAKKRSSCELKSSTARCSKKFAAARFIFRRHAGAVSAKPPVGTG